ncbi:MAG: threonine-phosphate decarboxylase [Fusicatenibacter sp.]|nr:pyridoxal phosphate-dependent class II aminotransferase [Lachnospiraceae bacterium]MDY2938264.1 threonine-phosphate decarboxylase [Fusicatenibacter sp.]
MRWNPHGGDIYSQTYDYDFSVNVNPCGTPDRVKQAVIDSVCSLQDYPDSGCTKLTAVLSQKEQVPEEEIIFGNGAAELIYALVHTLRPKKALLCAPSFAEYESALLSAGCFIRFAPLMEEQGFALTEDFLEQLTEDLDLVILCNPNNPTGIVTNRKLLLRIAKICQEKKIFLMLDECFVDLTLRPEEITMKGYLDQYPEMFLLKAFTKTYAMPGLRLGYGFCKDEHLIERMYQMLPSWNVSIPAQNAGIAALSEDEYVNQAREIISKERPWMKQKLEEFGMTVWDSGANFLFFRGPKGLAQKLKRGKILIRDCSNYPGLSEGYYRVAVRCRRENEVLMQAIEQIMRWCD